jgi:GT2 family glycosyltransferase
MGEMRKMKILMHRLTKKFSPILTKLQGRTWKLKTAFNKRKKIIFAHFGLNKNNRRLRTSTDSPTSFSVKTKPQIIFIVMNDGKLPKDLIATVQAIQSQIYTQWKLFICSLYINDDVSSPLQLIIGSDVSFDSITINNQAPPLDQILPILKKDESDYFLIVNAGDTFPPNFLYSIVAYLNQNDFADILYFDEDELLGSGKRARLFLKPDWSPEMLFSSNYLEHALINKKLLDQIENSQLQNGLKTICDLIYVASETAHNIIHYASPIYHKRSDQPDLEVLCKCIEAHLRRENIQDPSARPGQNGQIHVTWPVEPELVSIIIPTQDNYYYLEKCLSSIFSRTSFLNYEVILVDNASQDSRVKNYYQTLLRTVNSISIIEGGEKFNYSRFNNLGAQNARGKYYLFLNNDVEIEQRDWIDELVQWASLPEIGIVGAKLLYPNRTIQHAGIIVGLEGHASHIFMGLKENDSGIFGSSNWYRDYLAVTGACMMMRRDVFEKIGGFNETYQLAFNDVEICLKAIQMGLRVMVNPYSTLIHFEGKSRQKYIPKNDILVGYNAVRYFVENGDPYFNPNLSYSVRIPILAEPGEETPIQRLNKIIKYS